MTLPRRRNAIERRLRNILYDATPRAKTVLKAFNDARRFAATFRLSSGLLPEVSEACSARLFDIVQHLGAKHFRADRHQKSLRTALRRALPSPEAFDEVDRKLAELREAEVTAAYLFGLSVGLANPGLEADSAS